MTYPHVLGAWVNKMAWNFIINAAFQSQNIVEKCVLLMNTPDLQYIALFLNSTASSSNTM